MLRFTIVLAGAALDAQSAQAQTAQPAAGYAVRPIPLIIPYSPGGAPGNIARLNTPRGLHAMR